MGFLGLTNSAPSLGPQNTAGWGQSADQTAGLGLAAQYAQGKMPSAADFQMRAGLQQAQAAAAAQAASTRGNFGLAGAQRSAQGTQAGLAQQAIYQGAAQRAQEQQAALGQYLGAAGQSRSQALQGSQLASQQAIAQAQIQEQQNQANQAAISKLAGAGLSIAGGAATGGAMFSDEQVKEEAGKPQESYSLGRLASQVKDASGSGDEATFGQWLHDEQRKQLAEAGVPHASQVKPVAYQPPSREAALMAREQVAAPAAAPVAPQGARATWGGEDTARVPGEDLVYGAERLGMVGPARRAQLAAMSAHGYTPQVPGGTPRTAPTGAQISPALDPRTRFVSMAPQAVDVAPEDDGTWLAQMAAQGYRPTGDVTVSDQRAKDDAREEGYQAAVRDVTGNRPLLQQIAGPHAPLNVRTPEGGFYVRTTDGSYQAVPYSPPPPQLPPPPMPAHPAPQGEAAAGKSLGPVARNVDRGAPRAGGAISGVADYVHGVDRGATMGASDTDVGRGILRGMTLGLAGQDATPSDARLKQMEGQHPGQAAAGEFLSSLEPHTFTWKDPSVAPNPKAAAVPNLGVFAQQVERSPWGKAIVQQDPATGLKTLDNKAMLGALAAGAGAQKAVSDDHAQRLERVEAALGLAHPQAAAEGQVAGEILAHPPGHAGTREPISFTRIRDVPVTDADTGYPTEERTEETWRPPPPTLDERRVAGLAQLAAMRRQALGGVAPGRALIAAREAPAGRPQLAMLAARR